MSNRDGARLRASLIAAVVLGAMFVTAPAHAATFAVNSTADKTDANPADGVCNANARGVPECTLRAAIQQANALAGADSITVPTGTYLLTLAGSGEDNGATGDLDVNGDTSIAGAGFAATIVMAGGAAKDRVFHIRSGAASLSGLTVRGGSGVGTGGGVQVESSATLSNVALEQNDATSTGGGLHANGPVIIMNGSVTGNTARVGGGVYATAAVQVSNSSFASNVAQSNGGGLTVDSSAQASISGSTFSQNSALNGAGIFAEGSASLTNSTVSGNSSTIGAGISAAGGPVAALTLDHVTIAFNTASGQGGGIHQSGAMAVRPHASIVSNNSAGNCTVGDPAAWSSQGYNVSNDVSCGLSGSGDKPSQDPKLGPLTNNGGSTSTHDLTSPSPAIEAVPTPCPSSDQRGNSRPLDGDRNGTPMCDAGAVEALPPAPVVAAIELSPPEATRELGASHAVTVTVRDQFNNPFANGLIMFTVDGANQASGQGTTSADGTFVVNYSGTNPGQDTVSAFADRTADGQHQPDEPQGTVKVAWQVPGPPPAPECQGNPGAVCGTTGDDAIVGTDGDDLIITGEGNDTIDCGGGNDTVVSGAGVDSVNCGDGNDEIQTGDGDDVVQCGGGDDEVDGGLGSDSIDCGDGADVIAGGEGSDDIVCGADADSADGGPGDDSILCGEGDDSVQGGDGADNVQGEDGNDLIVGDPTGASMRVTAVGGTQSLTASSDTLDGGAGKDVVLGRLGDDTAIGGPGLDYVDGDGGNDLLDGSGGNDAIRGDEGNDRIKGGRGKDALEGNLGKNGYDGGPGTDTCYIASGKNTLKSCEKKRTTLKRNNM